MHTEDNLTQNSIGRMIFVGISILLQVGWILLLILRLNEYSVYISLCTSVLTLLIVLHLYNQRTPMGFRILWIMVILAFPVLGVSLYFMAGQSEITKGMRRRLDRIDEKLIQQLKSDEKLLQKLQEENIAIANQMKYISRYAKFPVYQNTDVKFYAEAEEAFEAQLDELKKAEKFIFLEYHAIEDAVSFGRMKKILAKKASEGVEVRILYDDMGSIGFIDSKFIKRMEHLGIKCRVFNPLVPVLNIFMNNRDHRKLTVIDGKVGFTGGYNLADRYFNLVNPYGYWKDSGILLKGDGVKSLTFMFLEMWSAMSREPMEDASVFFQKTNYVSEEDGYIQPYADTPLDDELVGENVYMNVVKMAKRYVYFTTPYLIISDELERELTMAVKRGVDVRIITPGIPDKKAVYEVTRSYYEELAKAGVRIYEYTPGFLHAKECICDDEIAVIGTINLDYRSLYLHFENGVLMYRCKAVDDMKKDYHKMLCVSKEVTEDYCKKQPVRIRIRRALLRVFAPLL